MTPTLSAAIALLLVASPARAAGMTGNELLKYCEDRRGPGHTLCVGYVGGVADLMRHLTLRMPTMIDENGTDGREYLAWCPGDGVTAKQLVDVVVRELRADPEHRHVQAYALVAIYLGIAFPC